MKIKIAKSELQDYRLLDFSLVSNVNEHTVLELELESIKDIDTYGKEIIIEKNGSIIFLGKIKESFVRKYEALSVIRLKAYSYSKLLEDDKINVMYQDENLSYFEIIEGILKKYNLKYVISDKLKIKTNRMFVKYEEDDFSFIKRILTYIDEIIYTSYNGVLVVGFLDLSEIKINNSIMQGIKNNDLCYKLKNEIYLAGDICENRFVKSSITKLINAVCITDIELSHKKDYKNFYKSNIQGAFLEGVVTSISPKDNKAMLKVDFSKSIQDDSKNKKSIYFATPYSKLHTGFYVCPEIGDVVSAYFPSNDENDVRVAFCINNDDSIRFCNYNKRNFISSKLELIIENDNFYLNCDNIYLESLKDISLKGSGFLAFTSKNEINVSGDEINISSKNNNIELNTKANILLKAKKVLNN